MTKFDQTLNYFRNLFLAESPIRIGKSKGNANDKVAANKSNAAKIKKLSQSVDEFVFNGTKLILFRDYYGVQKLEDNWLTDEPFLASSFTFIEEGRGLNATGVWNHQTFKSLCRKLIFNYYLVNYDFVISDRYHADEGETYWRKIIKEGLEKGYHISIVHPNGREEDLQPYRLVMDDEIWGSSTLYGERVKIYSLKKSF